MTSREKNYGTTPGGTGIVAVTAGVFDDPVASTGTGDVVRSTSPTLVAPVLGTPASGNLINCTGAVTALGSITGLGSGIATWLATPTSANLATALTDETGSGKVIFSAGTLAVASGKTLTASQSLTLAGTDTTTMTFPTTSATIARTDAAQSFTGVQTFVAPILGTPTSGTLTNCTGLPAAGVVGTAAVLGANTFTGAQTLRAGTTAAGTAPAYFQSGPLLTSAVAGAVEFLTDTFYGTITTGAARKEFTLNDITLTAGSIPYTTTNGRLTDSSQLVFDTTTGLAQSASINGNIPLNTINSSAGAAASTSLRAFNGTNAGALVLRGTGFTTSGLITANGVEVVSTAGTLLLYTASSNNVYIATGSNAAANARITCYSNTSVGIGAGAGAIATNATDGFLYVPTCAGTPTGTPTAITGLAPIVINTTNNKLYFYSNGAWRDAGP